MASYETFVKTWSEVVGVPAQVKTVSVEEADKAVPGGLGREAAESTSSSAEFGWGKDLLLPQDVSLILFGTLVYSIGLKLGLGADLKTD